MIEGIKKIREAFRKITAGLRKDGTINVHPECESYIKEKLEEGERHTNKKIEVPGEAIIFADGEKVAKLTNIKIEIRNIKREARKLYNAGNNERKMNGQPLKRFIAKQKVRKRKVSESDTMK